MTVRKAALALAAVALGAGTISAQQEKKSIHEGLRLYDDCVEKGRKDELSWGICHGFILGAAAGASQVRSSGRPDSCIEDGVTNGQIHEVVTKYLVDHPELRHRKSVELILAAVTEAFCKPAPTKR